MLLSMQQIFYTSLAQLFITNNNVCIKSGRVIVFLHVLLRKSRCRTEPDDIATKSKESIHFSEAISSGH